MTLQLGDTAPDFEAETTLGRITFHEWLAGDWGVLFSHPRDFTPVCTTELGQVARLQRQFDERGVKLIALSLDTLQSHQQWLEDIRETQGTIVHFPVVADLDRSIANAYGMLHPGHDPAFTVRTVFVIDPARRIRLTITYPQTCGRNFQELLRAIDSLQLTDAHDVFTPAAWRAGEDVIISPALSDEEARSRFAAGWRSPAPYVRLVPDPRGGRRTTPMAESWIEKLASAMQSSALQWIGAAGAVLRTAPAISAARSVAPSSRPRAGRRRR
jgi:alkyl hydroperoxide reductase subunit AhpC